MNFCYCISDEWIIWIDEEVGGFQVGINGSGLMETGEPWICLFTHDEESGEYFVYQTSVELSKWLKHDDKLKKDIAKIAKEVI